MSNSQNSGDDFRNIIYEKYVSAFHDIIWKEDEPSRRADFESYKKILLPKISDFDFNAEIIDLGCGSGYLLQFLKEQGYQDLYGVDISEEQVAKLRSRKIKGEVNNLFDFIKSNKRQYDLVFAMDIIEHFNKKELLPLFIGMRNLLKDNGMLIIHTPNGQSPLALQHIYGDLTHLTIFNPTSLKQILALSGFKSWKFYETGPTSKNLKGLIRMFLWRIIKAGMNFIKLVESGGKEEILTQDFICIARKN